MSHTRRLVAEVGLAVLLVALADVGVGYYASLPDAPLLPSFFPFPIASVKYVRYRELSRRGQDVDVLLMGLSPMLRVDARRLGEILHEDDGIEVRAFNFATPGHWVLLDQELLERVLLPLDRPRVIAYGVLPLNLLLERDRKATEEHVAGLPVFDLYRGTPASWLEEMLLNDVAILRYRESIAEHLSRSWTEPPYGWLRMSKQTDEFGDIHFPARPSAVRSLTRAEEAYARNFRSFDERIRSGLLVRHLKDFAEFCRARDIRLVIVNTPVHPLFMSMLPHGKKDYQRFMLTTRRAAANARVPFCNPAGGSPDPNLFRDTHHANEPGARWLTTEVARCVADALRREPFDGTKKGTGH